MLLFQLQYNLKFNQNNGYLFLENCQYFDQVNFKLSINMYHSLKVLKHFRPLALWNNIATFTPNYCIQMHQQSPEL